MFAENGPELHSPVQAPLIWLGGSDVSELGEPRERATAAVAGLIVLLNAALTALTVTVVLVGATAWPLPAVFGVAVLCGVLLAAVIRAATGGSTGGWRNMLGRAAVALAIGVIGADLAALAIFGGSVDRQLDASAARTAAAAPAVLSASADLDRARHSRAALDDTVEQARVHRDDALVVARCEYHPTPACPQTSITGVPGAGPETRTSNGFLADTQRELNQSLAVRDQRAPELDGDIATAEQALTAARTAATATADRGLGARWVAMNDYSRDNSGALLLRLALIVVFALLALLPLIIRWWRGQTTQERHAAARAEIDRAELQADTAIAVKRAEVRAATEVLWAEQQLATARLAIEAQNAIDEAAQRRRVAEALDGPIAVTSQRQQQVSRPLPGPDQDMYLPIAAAAEAASLAAVAELPTAAEHLPVPAEPDIAAARSTALIPAVPDLARTAARWLRPLVPPAVARAIDTTVAPVRAARQALGQTFEEFEEITFTLKRTHKVNLRSEADSVALSEAAESSTGQPARPTDRPVRVQSQRPARGQIGAGDRTATLAGDRRGELRESDGPRALPGG